MSTVDLRSLGMQEHWQLQSMLVVQCVLWGSSTTPIAVQVLVHHSGNLYFRSDRALVIDIHG